MATATSGAGAEPGATTRFDLGRLIGGRFLQVIAWLAATSIIIVTCMLVLQLWQNSGLSRAKSGWGFLFSSTWDPVAGTFGSLPFIFGTVVTSALALLIAVPIGVGAATFLSELAPPKISNILTFLIELLAAVPSVIYGLLGVFVLIPLLSAYVVPALKSTLGFLPIFQGAFYGVSLFSAGFVLAIMIVPFIISVSREVLIAVPREIREASFGLGATSWETTWHVVMPYARRGIFGSVFLALARALGETMAVTMVVGNMPKVQTSLLAPGYSIAAVIANEFTEATGDLYLSGLIELGLVLFALTVVLNAVARFMIMATTKSGERYV